MNLDIFIDNILVAILLISCAVAGIYMLRKHFRSATKSGCGSNNCGCGARELTKNVKKVSK